MSELVYESRRLTTVISGPLLWTLHFLLVYAGMSIACATGWGAAGKGIASVNLLLIALSLLVLGLMAFRVLHLLRWLRRTAGRVEGADERGEVFRGALALLLYVMSFIAVAWITLPLFMVAPCQ